MLSPFTPTQQPNTIPITEYFRSPLSDEHCSRGWHTLFQLPRTSDFDRDSFDRIYEGRSPNDYQDLLPYWTVSQPEPEPEPTPEAQHIMAPTYPPVYCPPSTPPMISYHDPQHPTSIEPGLQAHSHDISTVFDMEMKEPTRESQTDAFVAAPVAYFDGPPQQGISQGNQHPTPTPTPTSTIQIQNHTPAIQQPQAIHPVLESTQNAYQCTHTSPGEKIRPGGSKGGKPIKSYEERKKWQCPDCPMKATCKHNMLQHIRTHTGEKPFHCELCGNVYPRPWSVTRHLKSVHKLKHEDLKLYYQGREQSRHLSPAPNTQQFALPEFNPRAATALPATAPIAIAAPPTPEPAQIAGIRKDDMSTWPLIFITPLPKQSTPFMCIECNTAKTFPSAVDLQFHRHIVHHAAVSRRCTCSICVHAFQNEMQTGGAVQVAQPEMHPVVDDFFPEMVQMDPDNEGFPGSMAELFTRSSSSFDGL